MDSSRDNYDIEIYQRLLDQHKVESMQCKDLSTDNREFSRETPP